MNDLSDNSLLQLRTLIREEVSTLITPLEANIGDIKQDVGDMKQDITGLKLDVTGLKQDMSVVKKDITGLKQDVGSLKQDVTGLKQDSVSLKEDVQMIKLVQGSQSIMLGEVRTDVRSIKNGFRSQVRELHKLGVLFEDLDDRFQATAEAR